MITIKIKGGPSFTASYSNGMNAQTALEEVINDPANKGLFTFMLQYYGSGLGYLVDMINGTYDTVITTNNTGQPYYFWDFVHNHHHANKGIDNTFLEDGDEIGFDFERYVPEQHEGTNREAKFKSKTTS